MASERMLQRVWSVCIARECVQVVYCRIGIGKLRSLCQAAMLVNHLLAWWMLVLTMWQCPKPQVALEGRVQTAGNCGDSSLQVEEVIEQADTYLVYHPEQRLLPSEQLAPATTSARQPTDKLRLGTYSRNVKHQCTAYLR